LIKIPKFIISFLKLLNLYVLVKHIYYKYFKFIHLIKNNNENNLFEIFLNRKSDIQFLDIGTYKGNKIDQILNINPYSKIIGIEPFSKYYLSLKKKYSHNQNIKILNYAISDTNSVRKFYYNNIKIDKEAFSLKKSNKFKKIQIVNTKKLSDIVLQKSISIIKIDTEGSEYDILKKSKKIFLKKQTAFFVETTHLTFGNLKKLFKNNEYEIYIYEYNIFKNKLKNNWSKKNVIQNDEFDNTLYEAKTFNTVSNEFMCNIIAIPLNKKNLLKNFLISEKIDSFH
jgi:FkbM family methyltransferase